MKAILLLLACTTLGASARQPDILFIAVDDLNDWIGGLGGHPQTLTPNFDRLASQSVLFTNAHCPAPSCGPSRAAILSGIAPHHSGLYDNMQPLREIMPDATLLPRHFSNHGYHAAGSGKILHYVIDPPSWDDYFPEKSKDNPLPETLYPEQRPVSLPRGGPWQYVETDWGPLKTSDKDFGGDHAVTGWISERLAAPPEKPFFLACGLYRPHEPWFVPAKYFEPFPLAHIQLPPGYRPDDLDDVPPAGRTLARNRYFPHIQWHGQWRQGVQAYLASIHFADAMLGRVLDALENSPRRDNTIVVLWSDHGWHLGEKEHWQKYTGWRACSRIPLMIHVPKGVPGLPAGTTPATCAKPVSTLDLFPTLVSLTDVPPRGKLDGHDLTPLLANPQADWPHLALTQLRGPGDFALSGERFRYIHYQNGEEELYDIMTDPHEFTNLAADPAHASTLARFRTSGPADAVPYTPAAQLPPALRDLPEILLTPGADVPPSGPGGEMAPVHIRNTAAEVIRLFWIDQSGARQARGEVAKAAERTLQSHTGHSWLVETTDGKSLGHFVTPEKGVRVKVE